MLWCLIFLGRVPHTLLLVASVWVSERVSVGRRVVQTEGVRQANFGCCLLLRPLFLPLVEYVYGARDGVDGVNDEIT